MVFNYKSVKIEMLEQQPKFESNLTVRTAIENQLTELKDAKKEYEEKLKLDREEYGKELLKIDDEVAAERDRIEDKVLEDSKKTVAEMNDVVDRTEEARENLIKISESSFQ